MSEIVAEQKHAGDLENRKTYQRDRLGRDEPESDPVEVTVEEDESELTQFGYGCERLCQRKMSFLSPIKTATAPLVETKQVSLSVPFTLQLISKLRRPPMTNNTFRAPRRVRPSSS